MNPKVAIKYNFIAISKRTECLSFNLFDTFVSVLKPDLCVSC